MRPGLYRCAMRLARFRRLAWMLVLVLLTGLAPPAFASAPGTADGTFPKLGVHVHSDGTVHVHARPPAHGKAQLSDPASAKPTKAPHHCPGCLHVHAPVSFGQAFAIGIKNCQDPINCETVERWPGKVRPGKQPCLEFRDGFSGAVGEVGAGGLLTKV